MKLLIINGPNLNMLGIREPDIYGRETYRGLCEYIENHAKTLDVEVDIYQSNSEGDIVTRIQQAYGHVDGIVINPAAYTHTSVAILDAMKAVAIPAVEVHLSDINLREDFRHISYAGMACEAHYVGLGFEGYTRAMEYLVDKYGDKTTDN